MIKKFRVVLLIVLVFSTCSLYASVVSRNNISNDGFFVQIAVLKNIRNVNNVKKRLDSYDLYIENYKNMKKIYIVNLKNKEELYKIKKIYPTAFISKRAKRSVLKLKEKVKNKEILQNHKPIIGVFEVYDKNSQSIEPGVIDEIIDNNSTNKVLEDKSAIFEENKMSDLEKILNEKPEGSDLDSTSILKTRKSFL